MKEYKIDGHISSYLPEEYDFRLIWQDEFDGDSLDRSKWNFRLNYWGKPGKAYTDQGVIVRNGCVELHRTERDGMYVSPQLQTGANSFDHMSAEHDSFWDQNWSWPIGKLPKPTFMHRYGYYECRCKFQKYPEDMWSAFWLQSPSIGMTEDPTYTGIECDIMEHFHVGEVTSGNFYGGYGKGLREDARTHTKIKEDGFHTFALLWTPDEYVFYVDGKETARTNKVVSHVPQFILLTTEIQGYRRDNGLKSGNYFRYDPNLPKKREQLLSEDGKFKDDCFICDYVRVFDIVK